MTAAYAPTFAELLGTGLGSADGGTSADQAEGSGSIPTPRLHFARIAWATGCRLIEAHHYLRYAPPTGRIAYGVFENDHPFANLIGAILYARPAARGEDQVHTLEIRRLCILDVTAKNAESRVIGWTIRDLRKRFPEVARVIAYADPAAGHQGTIYKAAGFKLIGETNGGTTQQGQRRFDITRHVIEPSRRLKYELAWAPRPPRRERAQPEQSPQLSFWDVSA